MRNAKTVLLCAMAALAAACADDQVRNTLPPGVRVDTYTQVTVGKVDVLFVIDNSQSTEDKQENLARNFKGFFDFLQSAQVDYHIAVTTTDVTTPNTPGTQGRLFGTPEVITPATPNPVEAFQANARVGTKGSGYEAGLDAARRTLELKPQGFLRPDAYLFIIFVSDDEDHSEPGVPRFFYRFFEQQKGKGNEGMVSAGAIVGDAPGGCFTPSGGQARAAVRYKEVVELVGGRVGSICSEQFDVILRELGVDAVGLKRKWPLSRIPDTATIQVTVRYPCGTNEVLLDAVCSARESACSGGTGTVSCTVKPASETNPDGWTYEPSTSTLVFKGLSLPPKGSEIDVQYYEQGQAP
jgi:hypothetical protein